MFHTNNKYFGAKCQDRASRGKLNVLLLSSLSPVTHLRKALSQQKHHGLDGKRHTSYLVQTRKQPFELNYFRVGRVCRLPGTISYSSLPVNLDVYLCMIHLWYQHHITRISISSHRLALVPRDSSKLSVLLASSVPRTSSTTVTCMTKSIAMRFTLAAFLNREAMILLLLRV